MLVHLHKFLFSLPLFYKLCYNMKDSVLKGGVLMYLKKYFTFEGRINRAKYFFIPLILEIITIPFYIMAEYTNSNIFFPLYVLLSILVYILEVCITVQRLHDIERPGTHFWLLFIPIYNIYLGILLLFIKGTYGPNKYGEDPLAVVYE